MEPIYLDYNATTPVDPEVANAMLPYLTTFFGNPSSSHSYGMKAKAAVETARAQVASLIQCRPDEIVFTSGGTESNNLAIKGIAYKFNHKGNHIITSSIEHPAVLEVCKYLENNGFRVTYLPVDNNGTIDMNSLEDALSTDTILVSIMHANNEVGTIQPLAEIATLVKNKDIIFHTDAAQTVGKIDVGVNELNVDLLSIAGHKLYGPKGIGALYIRTGIQMDKILHGADHEQNRRAGTENVLEIVGLGKACEVIERNLSAVTKNLSETCNLLYEDIRGAIPDTRRNGNAENSLPNTLSLSFKEIEADLILSTTPEIAASAGAACHSDQVQVSHVLKAMKIPEEYAMGTIRFSTGKYTTDKEVRVASEAIIKAVQKLLPDNKSGHGDRAVHQEIKLTHYTHGLGCACKMNPSDLSEVLKKLPKISNDKIIVDSSHSDDAAVYRIDASTALIQTVDFITPIVDAPFDFGAISAANALSDIYAMAGIPRFALNIVGFPSKRLPLRVLDQIIDGAKSVADEADIHILGGHTIEDNEPKFGMVITGFTHPDRILTNKNAKPGDVLILTKPLGTGIISTGLKKGIADQRAIQAAIHSMRQLNKIPSEIANSFNINACTDITGFGLLGHLYEMIQASNVSAELNHPEVPLLPGVPRLIQMGIIPGGTKNNLAYSQSFSKWGPEIPENYRIAFCDAQTSGGLLFSVPERISAEFLGKLLEAGIEAKKIGNIVADKKPFINIL